MAISILAGLPGTAVAQERAAPPRLVVTVVVDQMRHEFLDRFYGKFGEGGFKRLLRGGADYRNGHYDYMPTATGPGHAAVSTGALPAVSGIVGNGWYDRAAGRAVNVVSGDTAYATVGVPDTFRVGQASPRHLLTTTFGDELKKASNFRAKVAGVGIKDRAAILSSGHTADAAYWFDARSGRFVTSSYYRTELPAWARAFNDGPLKDSLNNAVWSLLLPATAYRESRPDSNAFERAISGKEVAAFPYDLPAMNRGYSDYYLIPYTPFGNLITERFAEALVRNEGFGADAETDLLALNFSSPDYAGHAFGPYSVEVEDMYLRLDRTLARFLNFLDATVGRGEYVVALTADHGAVANPLYLRQRKIPAAVFNPAGLASRARAHLAAETGIDSLILHAGNMEMYLDHAKLPAAADRERASRLLRDFLLREEVVHSAYTAAELQRLPFREPSPGSLLRNGFFPQRSGDVLFVTKPGVLGFAGRIVTGHGTPWSYDTHVPIVLYGKGVRPGHYVRRVSVTDIAPTLSFLARVMLPNGAFGEPLREVFGEGK